MGKRVIDVWAKRLLKQKFQWGVNDCHQLLYQFVKLHNLDWTDPNNLGRLAGTYSTWREANKVAKTLDIPTWFEELGYERRPVNRLEDGDVVWMPSKTRAWDVYMPVVFGQTVICGDPQSQEIRLRHIAEFDRYYEVYRRRECQQ
jgi:hypothetical protein